MTDVGAATELLPYGADRDDRPTWLAVRRHGVTASEIAIILGLSKWHSPTSLYYVKSGILDEDEQGDYRMELGIALEPYVLAQFQKMTDIELGYCGLLANYERAWQLATPDAVIGNIPVEAKTSLGEDAWGPTGSDQIPLYYRCQLLWQMDVLGADTGYLCVIFLRSGEPRWYQIGWDGGDIALMRDAARDFLDDVAEGVPPAVDGSEATTRTLRGIWQADQGMPPAVCGKLLRRQYAAALRQKRLSEARHRLMANRIREAMGTSTRLVDANGVTVATRRGPKDALYPGKDLTGDDD